MYKYIKNILILTVLIITTYKTEAQHYNNLKLIGSIHSRHSYPNQNLIYQKDTENIKLGFNITSNTNNNNIYAYATWLFHIQSLDQNTENFSISTINTFYHNSLLSYVGIHHKNWGDLSYGRNYTVIYDILAYSHILPYNPSYFIKLDTLTYILSNTWTYHNTIKFPVNSIIKNLQIKLQYYNPNNRGAETLDILKSHKAGIGGLFTYTTPINIQISAAYIIQARDCRLFHPYNPKKDNDYMRRTFFEENTPTTYGWIIGAKYHKNDWYIGTSFSTGQAIVPIYGIVKVFDDEYHSFSEKIGFANANHFVIIIKYKAAQFEPIIQFIQTYAKNVRSLEVDKDLKTTNIIDLDKYLNIGLLYHFNNHVYAYTNYRINNIINVRDNQFFIGLPKDHIFSVGFVYNFE